MRRSGSAATGSCGTTETGVVSHAPGTTWLFRCGAAVASKPTTCTRRSRVTRDGGRAARALEDQRRGWSSASLGVLGQAAAGPETPSEMTVQEPFDYIETDITAGLTIAEYR